MRSRHKEWKNKWSGGFTRRVIWYEPGFEGETIRLKFEDEDGVINKFYTKKEDAQIDYDAFRSNTLTTSTLRARK